MFNPFLRKNHPLMDANSDVGGGAVTPQTGTEGTPSGEPTGSETGTEGAMSTVTDPASQKVQTPETNAAFAKIRREAEQAKREAEQAKQALAQRDQWVAQQYGSQGITTWDQYQAALAEQERQQKEQGWRDQGLDPNQIREIMRHDPEYQQLKQQTEQYRQELTRQQGEALLKTEIAELAAEYPDLEVKTIQDLQKLPNFEDIMAKAQKGYSLLDAYESANKADIRKQQAEAARQATLNSVSGKGHLKGNGKGTEVDTTTIPDDVLEMYKTFNPGKTLDEYKAHYKTSLK